MAERSTGLGLEAEKALACPNCRAQAFEAALDRVTCTHCGKAYPVLRDAIDFRDVAKDRTAGFSVPADMVKARMIDAIFDQVPTFLQVARYFYALERKEAEGIDLETLDPLALLAEENIAPEPMSPELLAHGPAILEKLPGYLARTAYPAVPNGVALEGGCGQALYVDGLARHFDHLFVLDISMVYLLFARKIMEERGLRNVTLVCGIAEHMPFADEAFDFIHSNNVIEHVSDQAGLVAEARRTLKEKGLLLLMSPNRFSLYVEPHFKLPAFGFIPRPLSRWIIRRTQGRAIENVSLRSLSEFRLLATRQFGRNVSISFIPRHLSRTATGGLIRGTITSVLNSRLTGGAADFVINRLALGMMPYHVALCWKSLPSAGSTD